MVGSPHLSSMSSVAGSGYTSSRERAFAAEFFRESVALKVNTGEQTIFFEGNC